MKKWLVGLLIVVVFVWCTPAIVGYLLLHPMKNQEFYMPSEVGLKYKDITFLSGRDNIPLKGWVIPTKGDRWVILSHGYTENRNLFPRKKEKSLQVFQYFHKRGYNVLTFDYRHSGESGGEFATIGYHEQEDLKGAISYILKEQPNAQIGLMGWSQGAATSLMVGSQTNVTWIIADSSFADLSMYVEKNLSYWTKLPNKPFTPWIIDILVSKTGINPHYISPITSINDSKAPILLIHSEADQAIPIKNSVQMYRLFKDRKDITLLRFNHSKHTESFIDNEELYIEKVSSFLNRVEN